MTVSIIRPVTDDDLEILNERAAAFIARHDLRKIIDVVKAGEPTMTDYAALEELLWIDAYDNILRPQDRTYLRGLWTRVFRRATSTHGHYIAYGAIVSPAD